MAFRQPSPPTQAFEIVGLEDPALDEVPQVLLDLYRAERKIDILDKPDEALGWKGLKSLDEQPTRCRCLPLKSQYLKLITQDMDSNDQWRIFATHCDRIKHLIAADGTEVDTSDWWQGSDDKRRLKTEVFTENRIPYRLWSDITNAIIHRGASGQDTPFILPLDMSGISREARASARRASQIATYARSKKSAKKNSSESSDETTSKKDSPVPTGEASENSPTVSH